MYSQSTVLLGQFMSFVLNFIGTVIQSIIALINATPCRYASLCTRSYLLALYSIILVFGIVSSACIVLLAYYVAFKIGKREECEDLCDDENCDGDCCDEDK